MAEAKALRIFVAMPGTDMGKNAIFKSLQSVKDNLLDPVADKLKANLHRDVDLVIEMKKMRSGNIHESMFAEAWDADVYIADLTGANPNVYLELGVRWALRDRTTVLIAQSEKDLKFNVSGNRVILYNAENLKHAVNEIVETIENGLNSDASDSLVRQNAKYLTIPKSELERLNAEIEELKRARGEDLLHAAVATENLADRVAILQRVTEVNPASVVAFLNLGLAYRALSNYDDAIKALQRALSLDPANAELHRELGVTYSKQGKFEPAAASLHEAVQLAPKDSEAWSNLGGALRKIGMARAPYDKDSLLKARDSYARAHDLKDELGQLDLYSGLNVARLDLLLSKWEPGRASSAKTGFSRQVNVSRVMVDRKPTDYWTRFDLADALLFSGEYSNAHVAYDEALRMVPGDQRHDTLSSVLGPLENYITAGVLDGELLEEVKKVIEKLTNSLR